MFNLAKLKDTMAIQPAMFGIPPADALAVEINKKYADKVLHDVGLCICLFDILDASEGKVRFGDGCLWHKVTFRMVVFRPFVGEVLVGEVKSSSEEGIQISVGFFDDIYVPAHSLPDPSHFDPEEGLHFWRTDDDPTVLGLDTPKDSRFYIDLDRPIRIRVESDEFYDEEPGPPKTVEGEAEALERRAPYSIICSAVSQGLGLVEWWEEDAEPPAEPPDEAA